MKKRLVIVIVVLVAVVGIVLVGYFLRARMGTAPAPASSGGRLNLAGGATETGNLSGVGGTGAGGAAGSETPAAPTSVLQQIAPGPVAAYGTNAASGTTIVVRGNGQIIGYSDGLPQTLSGQVIPGLLSASFSRDGRMALVLYGNSGSNQASVFDVTREAWRPLSGSLYGYAWSPDGHTLAYLTFSEGSYLLSTINFDSATPSPKTLVNLHEQGLSLVWPSKNTIVLLPQPSAWYLSSVWSFNISSQTLAPIAENQLGFIATWNSSGTLAAAARSSENKMGGDFWLMDQNGNVLRSFDVFTLPSKCAFGSAASSSPEYLYCAIPDNRAVFSGATVPDAYLERSVFTIDSFYKIDLSSGAMTSVFDTANVPADADDVSFSGGDLYFVNRYDGGLYRLSL